MHHDSLQFWTRAIRAGWSKSKQQARALRYAIDPRKSGDLVIVDGFPAYRLPRRQVAEALRASGLSATRTGRALGPQGVDNLVADALARGAIALLRDRLPSEIDSDYAHQQVKAAIRQAMRIKRTSDRRQERHLYVEDHKSTVENIADPTGWPGMEHDLRKLLRA